MIFWLETSGSLTSMASVLVEYCTFENRGCVTGASYDSLFPMDLVL